MDDKLKDQLLPAAMVFNFTLAIYVAARVVYPMLMSNRPLRSGVFFTHLAAGAVIGLVCGAVTLVVLMMRRK